MCPVEVAEEHLPTRPCAGRLRSLHQADLAEGPSLPQLSPSAGHRRSKSGWGGESWSRGPSRQTTRGHVGLSSWPPRRPEDGLYSHVFLGKAPGVPGRWAWPPSPQSSDRPGVPLGRQVPRGTQLVSGLIPLRGGRGRSVERRGGSENVEKENLVRMCGPRGLEIEEIRTHSPVGKVRLKRPLGKMPVTKDNKGSIVSGGAHGGLLTGLLPFVGGLRVTVTSRVPRPPSTCTSSLPPPLLPSFHPSVCSSRRLPPPATHWSMRPSVHLCG